MAIFAVSFASGIFGPAAAILAEQFTASETLEQLGISLFVAGFAAGPLVWGPIAEVVGMKTPLIVGTLGCALFHIPFGLAKNLSTILVSRFLTGAFGSAVLALGSGLVVKPYTAISRGIALACCATSINFGAVLAPIVASYMLDRRDWRFLAWIVLVLVACMVPALLFIKEEPATAVDKNEERGNHPSTKKPRVRCMDFAQIYLTRPVVLFCKEPILIIMTVHLTFVYGLLYMSFQLFPLAYRERGWADTTSTLPLLAVAIGLLASLVAVVAFMTTWFKRQWQQNDGVTNPEHCLPPMMAGAIILPPALLWFGWSMRTSWVCQALASAFIGFGLQLIFISGILYLVDAYQLCIVPAMSIHVTAETAAEQDLNTSLKLYIIPILPPPNLVIAFVLRVVRFRAYLPPD
ncbi:MFS domain-containing protein [Fusarium sp. LHS14.1]|nr:MFS domain-containing protein [Fusarium sp. LHS14.1]